METNWWGSARWFLWMKDQSRGSGLFGWSWILHEEKGGCCFEWRKGEWGEDVVFRRESGWCWLTCLLSCHCGLEVDLGVCLCWDQPMLMRGEIMLCVCVWMCMGGCGRLCGYVDVCALRTVYIMYACMNLGTCSKWITVLDFYVASECSLRILFVKNVLLGMKFST